MEMKTKIGIVPAILISIVAIMPMARAAIIPVIPAHVYVDIKPGSWPNPLNVGSKGVIVVAICGTEDFDAMTIDPVTVKIHSEDVEEGVPPLRWSWEDSANWGLSEYEGGDGYLDLILHFDTQEVVWTLTITEHPGETLSLIVRGNLFEEYAGAPIQGEDLVWILG